MTNPATTADLASRWRPLSGPETVVAETLVEDAWVMLKRRLALPGVDIETAIDTDPDLRNEAVRVVATAVLRVMKNPDGKSREAIDDYSWSRDETIAAGLLYFRDDEIDALTPGNGRGAFSVSLLPAGYPESRFQ